MGSAFDGLVEDKPGGGGHNSDEEYGGECPADGPSEEAETKEDDP
jgi:hypothetical protein